MSPELKNKRSGCVWGIYSLLKKLFTNNKFLIILQIIGLIVWSVGMYLIISREVTKDLDGDEDVSLFLTYMGVPIIAFFLSMLAFMAWIYNKNFKERLLVGSLLVIIIILGFVFTPNNDNNYELLITFPFIVFFGFSLVPKGAYNGLSSSSGGGGGCGGGG